MAIFTLADATALRNDRLMRVAQRLLDPDLLPSDDDILGKLQSAQADVELALRTPIEPREVYPTGYPAPDIAALGDAALEEAAYDYDPSMFSGSRFGMIELRHRPIISVSRLWFEYQGAGGPQGVFDIPSHWIQMEKRSGRLSLVPYSGSAVLPMNAFLLQALGGGTTIPLILKARYRCGLENVRRDHPNLIDVIKKKAVLSIVEDEMLPASSSISQDGLSESVSFESEKYRDLIEDRLDRIAQSIRGITVMVL